MRHHHLTRASGIMVATSVNASFVVNRRLTGAEMPRRSSGDEVALMLQRNRDELDATLDVLPEDR
jgi:hypothetical protein